jgi:hypothetical protein
VGGVTGVSVSCLLCACLMKARVADPHGFGNGFQRATAVRRLARPEHRPGVMGGVGVGGGKQLDSEGAEPKNQRGKIEREHGPDGESHADRARSNRAGPGS